MENNTLNDTLELIVNDIKDNYENKKTKECKYHLSDKTDKTYPTEYDSFTVNQILQIYKIQVLEETKIISSQEAKNLNILYLDLLRIESVLGKEINKEYSSNGIYKSTTKQELYVQIETIKEELNKYNILNSNFDILNAFKSMVKEDVVKDMKNINSKSR